MKRKNPKFIIRTDSSTLQLQYSYNGEWFRVNSHIKVDKKDWDEGSQLIRDKDRKEDNLILQGLLRRIEEIIYQYRLKHSDKPTVDYIRSEFHTKQSQKGEEILPLWDKFVVFKESFLRNASIYNAMKDKLNLFCSSKKYKSIKDISTSFKEELILYLVKDGLQNITIRRRIKVLHEFITWCRKKEGLTINENVDWEVKLNVNKSDGNIFILTDEEFEKLRKKELVLRLDRVRDIYVLGCSTGLRYSDLIRLDTEHVRGGYIEIITQKNGVFCRIPLNETSASILEKYNNCPPRISDQKLNKYLYELFRNMKITDKVSTIEWRGNQKKTVVFERCDLLSIHTSRKFFITNCISNGITSDSIMKWTGQSTLKVFYDYVLKGKKEAEQMKNIFKL